MILRISSRSGTVSGSFLPDTAEKGPATLSPHMESDLEREFWYRLQQHPEIARYFRYEGKTLLRALIEHPELAKRSYRCDWFSTELKIIIEVDGRGHDKHNHFDPDREKDNILQGIGWSIVRVSSLTIRNGTAFWHIGHNVAYKLGTSLEEFWPSCPYVSHVPKTKSTRKTKTVTELAPVTTKRTRKTVTSCDTEAKR